VRFLLYYQVEETIIKPSSKKINNRNITAMPTKITINNSGPIKVEGDIEVFDMNGDKFDLKGKTAVFFCRCGESAKKPFCDGAHKGCNFISEVKAI
jgi:CDGSH-type Zn-finger protein